MEYGFFAVFEQTAVFFKYSSLNNAGRFTAQAGVAQLVEHQLPKLRAAGSNPVSRSRNIGIRN